MTTLTEIVAAVVIQSSAAAYSHFGVTLEPLVIDQPPLVAERTVARTPRQALKVSDCPKTPPSRGKSVKT